MMRNLLTSIAVALSAVALHPALAAEPQPKGVIELIEAAKARPYVPLQTEQLTAARDLAVAWTKHLDSVLNGWGRPLGEQWKNYLLWNELQHALAQPIPTREELLNPDQTVGDSRVRSGSLARQLTDVWDRFRRDEPGLESAPFTGTRDAIRNYLDLLGAFEDLRMVMRKTAAGAEPPTPEQLYRQKLSDLADGFTAFQQNRNPETALQVRKPLFWLARQRQVPEVIAAVGTYFNQVNGEGQLSSSFMAKAVDQPVNQTSPIHDNILGTSIHGTGVMHGMSYMRPAAHNPNAQMNLSLVGNIGSKTVGYNGPVTIYSTGRTSVKAYKVLYMTPNGLISLPAHACCDTDTEIDCIAAKHRIVERIAWKRAGASLPEAEQIAARKAEAKVSAGLDERAQEFVSDANDRYRKQLLNPLIRAGVYPQLLSFASTASNMHTYFTRAAGGQLAAFERKPAADLRYDLTLQFHELLAINMSETRFGGWTLTDLESLRLRERLAKRKYSEAERSDVIDDDKRWSITFTEDMPVRVVLNNNRLRIVIRTKRFAIGESSEADRVRKEGELPGAMVESDSLYEPMQIEVEYEIVRDGANNVVAYMQRVDGGDADENGLKIDIIDPLTDQPVQAGGRATIWKSRLRQILVQKKRAAGEDDAPEEAAEPQKQRKSVFEKYYYFEPIKLEGRMAKLGFLVLDDFQTRNGWALMSWRQTTTPPVFKKPGGPETLPAAPALPAAAAPLKDVFEALRTQVAAGPAHSAVSDGEGK